MSELWDKLGSSWLIELVPEPSLDLSVGSKGLTSQ